MMRRISVKRRSASKYTNYKKKLRELHKKEKQRVRNTSLANARNNVEINDVFETLYNCTDPAMTLNLITSLRNCSIQNIVDKNGIDLFIEICRRFKDDHNVVNACLSTLGDAAQLSYIYRDTIISAMGGIDSVVRVIRDYSNLNFFAAIGSGNPPVDFQLYTNDLLTTFGLSHPQIFDILANISNPQYGHTGQNLVCKSGLLDAPATLEHSDAILLMLDNISLSCDDDHIVEIMKRPKLMDLLLYLSQIQTVADDVFRIASNFCTVDSVDPRLILHPLITEARKKMYSDVDINFKIEPMLFIMNYMRSPFVRIDKTFIADVVIFIMLSEHLQNTLQAEIFCTTASMAIDVPTLKEHIDMNIVQRASLSQDEIIKTTAEHLLYTIN